MGHPLTIGNFVTQSGISAIFTSVTNTYTPYLRIGDDAFPEPSQDQVITGQQYQEVLTDLPLSSQVLTGLFLDIDTASVGLAPTTVEKTLFDRIGYAARQSGVVSNINITPDSGPAISLSDLVTLARFTHELRTVHCG